MNFPVDQQRYLYGPKGYVRGLLQEFWGGWTAIIPWPWRVDLWNWTWELKGESRVKA